MMSLRMSRGGTAKQPTHIMRKFSFLKLTVLAISASVLTARAGTNGFIVPAFRGAAGAQAGYWETFTVAVGTPLMDVTDDAAGAAKRFYRVRAQ